MNRKQTISAPLILALGCLSCFSALAQPSKYQSKPSGNPATFNSPSQAQNRLQQQLEDGYSRYHTLHPGGQSFRGGVLNLVTSQRLSELENEKNRILADRQEEMSRQIDEVVREASNQLGDTPRNLYIGGRRIRNPDYRGLTRDLEDATNSKIEQIRRNFDKENADTMQYYARLEESCIEGADSQIAQPASAYQTIEMAPSNNNMYVHNYMNFGSSEPVVTPVVPLHAVEQKYGEPGKNKKTRLHR